MTSSLFYTNILVLMAHNLFSPFPFFLKIVCREKLLLLWRQGKVSMLPSTWAAVLGTGPGVDWQNRPLSNFPIFGIVQKKWLIKNSHLDVTVVWKNSSITTDQEPQSQMQSCCILFPSSGGFLVPSLVCSIWRGLGTHTKLDSA